MSKRRIYPAEFREQMIELVREGRTSEESSREFEPSSQTIRNWVAQADIDRGGSLLRTTPAGRTCYRK